MVRFCGPNGRRGDWEEVMQKMTRRALATSGLVLLLAAPAFAQMAPQGQQQQPQTVRVRGTIQAVQGPTLVIKARDGSEVKVNTTDNVAVRGIIKMSMSDIKQGSYVGVTGMPQPDGSQKAMEVHIFPEQMRGTGEGHRPWDLRPNSTMTNANVEQLVTAADGQTLTLKYKDGDKKIIVSPDTPIVTYVPGSKDELKPGANIFIGAAAKKPDGTLEASAISVGRDGLVPPM
jgi:hypothetical protein